VNQNLLAGSQLRLFEQRPPAVSAASGIAAALTWSTDFGLSAASVYASEHLQNTELRRRVHVGLNKGEAKNALAKAVFLNRLGEMRDRSFENQRYRSRSLNIAGHPKRVVQMIVPEVQLEEWPP
jgi:TnpA family transposase